MTKKELIKQVQRITTGVDAHTHILFGKVGRSWICYTGISPLQKNDYPEVENPKIAKHCCNNATLKEVEREFF